jgi:hypothetical protein
MKFREGRMSLFGRKSQAAKDREARNALANTHGDHKTSAALARTGSDSDESEEHHEKKGDVESPAAEISEKRI